MSQSPANISIEIGHVEFNEAYRVSRSKLQQSVLSAKLANQLKSLLDKRELTYSVSMLIDNKKYTELQTADNSGKVTGQVVDIYDVMQLLASTDKVIDLDYICFESTLRDYLPALFYILNENAYTRKSVRYANSYLEAHGVLPCSVDIAIWHLLRLGTFEDLVPLVPHRVIPVGAIGDRPLESLKGFIAKSVISILHEDYRVIEERADNDLLKHLPRNRKDLRKRIGRIYFNERTRDLSEAEFDFDICTFR